MQVDGLGQEMLAVGIYVVRTNEPKCQLSATEKVWHYKRLTQMERGGLFRRAAQLFDGILTNQLD